MAKYEVKWPDGNIYTVDAPAGISDQAVFGILQDHLASQTPAAPPPEGGFLDSLSAATQSLGSQSRTGFSAVTGDANAAAQAGLQRSQQIAQEHPNQATWADVEKAYENSGILSAIGTGVRALPSVVGQIVPSVALGGGAALLGGGIGALIGGPPGAAIGSALAAGASQLPANIGGNIEAQAEEDVAQNRPVDVSVGAAAGTGAAQSALDVIGLRGIFGPRVFGRLFGGAANKADAEKRLVDAAQRTLAQRVGQGALEGSVEMPVNVAQEVMQRAQAGQSLTDADAVSSYKESAFQGLGGTFVGAGAAPFTRPAGETPSRKPAPNAPVDESPEAAAREQQLLAEQGDAQAARQAALDGLQEDAAQAERDKSFDRDTRKFYRSIRDLSQAPDSYLDNLSTFLDFGEAPGPDRDRAIARLQSEQELRARKRELPPDEDARRAETTAADMRANPPAVRASRSAPVLARTFFTNTDTAQLRVLRDELRASRDNKSAEDRAVLEALNAELRDRDATAAQAAAQAQEQQQLQATDARDRAQTNAEAVTQLPPSLRAEAAAESFTAPVLTDSVLREAGLRRNSGFYKQLFGMDLSDPAAQAKASVILRDAQRNARLSDTTRASLTNLLSRPRFDPVRDAATDAAAHGRTPETLRLGPVTDEMLNDIGVSERSPLHRSGELQKLDLSKPEGRAAAIPMLEAYAQSGVAAPRAQSVAAFVDRLSSENPTGPILDAAAFDQMGVGRTAAIRKNADLAGVNPAIAADAARIADALNKYKRGRSSRIQEGVDAYLANLDAYRRGFDADAGVPVPGVDDTAGGTGVAVDSTGAQAPSDAVQQPASTAGQAGDSGLAGTERTAGEPAATGTGPDPALIAKAYSLLPEERRSALKRAVGLGVVNQDQADRSAISWARNHGLTQAEARRAVGAPTGRNQARAEGERADIVRGMLRGTKDELDTAVREGVLTPEQAAEIVETARKLKDPIEADFSVMDAIDAAYARPQITDRNADPKLAAPQSDTPKPTDTPAIQRTDSMAYEQARASGDLAGSVTPALTAALDAADMPTALSVIAGGADGQFNALESLVSQHLQDVADRTGGLPKIELVDSLPSRGGEPVLGQYDAVSDTVRLVRGEADSHTLLHETVHAFTHRLITQAAQNGNRDPRVKGLLDVYAHVRRNIPDAEQVYGMTNMSEFAAEAMSNPEFQMRLFGIPYKRQSLWSGFVDAVRRVLGMEKSKDPVQNTLFAALVHIDGLMEPGRRLQVDERGTHVVNPVVDLVSQTLAAPGQITAADMQQIAQAATQQKKAALGGFFSTFHKSADGTSAFTKVRGKMFDNQSSVVQKMQGYYEEGIRNAYGEMNPMMMLRQAVDSQRMASRMFERGGMEVDANTGYFHAIELPMVDANGKPTGENASIDQAMKLIAQFGERIGMGYREASARVSTVLMGNHLAELRTHNAAIEQQALAYEALGTRAGIDKAFAARQKKIRLHLLNSEIDALQDAYNKSPEMQQIQRTLNVVRENLVGNMVKSGRITAEKGAEWMSHTGYVPLNRIEEVFDPADVSQGAGRSGVGHIGGLPQLSGSYSREVANVIDNTVNTFAWMTGQFMKNRATHSVLEVMAKNGLAKKLGPKEKPSSKLPHITVYEGGNPVRYEMESAADVGAFLVAPDPENSFINLMTLPARFLRGAITLLPSFTINQNFQDVGRVVPFSGTRNSAATGARVVKNLLPGVLNSVRGRETDAGRILADNGVVGAFDYNPQNPLQTLERSAGVVKQGAIRKILTTMESIAKAGDQAARQAVYEQTMKETGDSALAITRARELINYNRRGSSRTVRMLSRVIPFFNAYMQGIDLMVRSISGQDAPSGLSAKAARNFFLSRMAMMTAVGFGYAAIMGDDEDYKNAPDYVRDKGFMFPRAFSSMFDTGGKHTPLIIPAPRELSFPAMTIPGRILQYFRDNKDEKTRTVGETLVSLMGAAGNAYVMEPLPPVIRQILETATNHSFFTGRPLVDFFTAQREPRAQFNRNTTTIARTIGDVLNVSPILVDNIMQGVAGSSATMLNTAVDLSMGHNVVKRPLSKLLGTQIFTSDDEGTRTIADFYDLKTQYDTALATLSSLKGDPEAYREFAQNNRQYLMLREWINSKNRAMLSVRDIRNYYTDERNEPGMSAASRHRKLRELDLVQRKILSDVPAIRRRILQVADGQ